MSDQQALSVLMKSPVTQEMIQHIVNATLKVIQCKKSKTIPSPPPSPSSASTSVYQKSKSLPSLMTFISRLVRYTNVYTGTLLSTLVYLEKLSTKLPKNAEGLPCTLHRIFLACLIISSKSNNDSSPKNFHWAKYTDGLFRSEDVNLMERQLLNLLDWDVMVSNNDLKRCLKKFIDPIKYDLKKATKVRRSISKQRLHQDVTSRQQLPPSPVSYREALHNRSSSTSSISSLSSNSSTIDSPDPTLISQQYIYNPISKDQPSLPYSSSLPQLQKSYNHPYSYTFDQNELNNYVPVSTL